MEPRQTPLLNKAQLASDRNDFEGVWTALATPMRQDGQIDWDVFAELLLRQEKAEVKGVVLAGTTGESQTLAVQEKLAMVRKARALLKPHVRVMAGTGDSNTQQSVELSRLAQDAGADSLLVVTPPYSKPNTAGLLKHYQAIEQAVQIPICLYHVPGRTAQMLTVEQLAAICSHAGIRAVKEASADMAFFSRSLEKTGIAFLSGDDASYLASLAIGGQGVISVISNVFPAEMVKMTRAFFAGDHVTARRYHAALMPMIEALFCESSPCPLKATLHCMGLGANVLRSPLAPISEANYQRVQEVLINTQNRIAAIGMP